MTESNEGSAKRRMIIPTLQQSLNLHAKVVSLAE